MNSVLLNHHFRRLNNSNHGVSLFEFQLIGTSPRDGAFNEVVSDTHDDMGHDVTEFHFLDCSTELVSG